MTKPKREWEKEFDKKFKCTSTIHYIECCEYPVGEAVEEIKQFIRTLLAQELRGLLVEKRKLNEPNCHGYNQAVKEINTKIKKQLKGGKG